MSQSQEDELKFALTGVELVDINILAQMDDSDLLSVCKIDRYTNSLYQKDDLWKQKINMKFPEAENFKDDTTDTWKDYYFRLTWIDLDKNIPTQNVPTQNTPSQDGVNEAAKNGYLDILNWIESFTDGIYPNQTGLNFAAKNGHVKILQWLADRSINTTDNHPLLWAAETGKVKVIQWYFESATPHEKSLLDQKVVNNAAHRGNLDVLKWFSLLPPPYNLYPDQLGVDGALLNYDGNTVKVLEWISNLPPPHNLLPHAQYLVEPVLEGRMDVLKWAAEHGLYPTRVMLSKAGRYGNYEPYMWASTLPEPHTIYPPQITSNNAAVKDRLDVVQWAASLPKEHRLYPDQYAIEKAKELGHDDIVEWLSTQPGPSGEYARKLLK